MKYLKLYTSIAVLTSLLVIAFISLKPSIANAATCPGGGNFGAGIGYGYFACTSPTLSNDDDVFPHQLAASSSASAFEGEITSQLNSNGSLAGTGEYSTGAAFIIDTMMGVSAGSCDRTVCDTTVAQWEALVTEYGSLGLIKVTNINWTCGITDTLYDPTANDDFYFTLEPGGSLIPCSLPSAAVQATVPVIEFLSPTTKKGIFNIKIDCGNPIGSLQAIPPPQQDTMSGSVQIKNTTTDAITNAPNGTVITLDNTTDPSVPPLTAKVQNGIYSIDVLDGDEFGLSAPTAPSGETGPYTDYQGAATFTDSATGTAGAPYNCGPTAYHLQVAGKTSSLPDNSGRTGSAVCETVPKDSDYNFVYLTSPAAPGTGVCNSLTASSGTGPTFTAVATYTLGTGVTYKSVSFSWGDGSPTSGGTNSNGVVTSGPHTYITPGTYPVGATLSFTTSSGTTTSICPPTSVTYTNNPVGGGPVFTCNTGSYDITPVVNPSTTYIGAGFPATITFNSSGQFESDSNNPYNDNLAQSVNQSSQLTVEATGTDNGLGITSPVTYPLSPGTGSVGPLSLQTSVGIYSVPYQVKIVQVVIDPDPATHWAPIANPNPTLETPAAPPASSYTNKTVTVAAPVYTTIPAPGNPTTGYYTQEKTTTTYTYTDTTTTPGPTTYTCPSGWLPPSGSPTCSRVVQATQKTTTIPATPHVGASTTTTTTVATDYSYLYNYYITWVSTPNVECPPPVPVQVGFQPYMKVYGGDVVAGSTFDPGLTTACTPLSSQRSNIVGWNYDTPNYSGGGTEYAGYALGAIDGFATSQGSANAGIGLSFASVGVSNNSPSSGEFGGSFIPVSCAPDFFDAKPASAASPPSTNVGNIPSGSYYQNGSFSTSNVTMTINTGTHVTIYVNGNAYINGNITLGGTWNTIGDIPSFELVVQNGNIYIDNTVTRLDGVYVAQDLNQNGTGTIYDCSVNQLQAAGAQFSNDCYQPLVINGSFIATQVDLMRTTSPSDSTTSSNTLQSSSSDRTTSGGSDNAGESGNASEVFNYSPAVWLGLTNNNLLGTDNNNTSLNNYNSITSLPPVL
jgi:hypothetical protein